MDNIIIYNTDDGAAKVSLYANDGTVWMTQAQMAELFNKERSGITRHIKNIFSEGELEEKSNVSFFHIANSDHRAWCPTPARTWSSQSQRYEKAHLGGLQGF